MPNLNVIKEGPGGFNEYIDERAEAVVNEALTDVAKLDQQNVYTAKQTIKGVINSALVTLLPQAPASYTNEQKETFWNGWQFRSNGGYVSYDSIYPDNIASFGWNTDGTVHGEPRMNIHFESAFRPSIGAADMFEINLDYVLQDSSLFRQIAVAGPRASANACKDSVGVSVYGNILSIGSYDNAANTNPEIVVDFRTISSEKTITIANDGAENTYLNLRGRNKPMIRQWVGGPEFIGLPHVQDIDWGGGSFRSTVFNTPFFGKKSSTMQSFIYNDANTAQFGVNGNGFSAVLGSYVSGLSVLDTRGLFWFRDEVGAYITHSNGAGTSFGRASYAISFFQAPPVLKQTVSGSRAGNAALESLLTALANYGLITNSTSA